jgi:hypothetical protein
VRSLSLTLIHNKDGDPYPEDARTTFRFLFIYLGKTLPAPLHATHPQTHGIRIRISVPGIHFARNKTQTPRRLTHLTTESQGRHPTGKVCRQVYEQRAYLDDGG